MFPFTITLKKPLNYIDHSHKLKVLNHIADYVEKNHGKNISLTDHELSFSVSFLGWSWDKFIQIEKGKFTLSDTSISFKFYMYRLLLIAVFMSTMMASAAHKLWVGIFFFIGLGLGNWIIALIRFNNMIKGMAEAINKMTKEKV
jgi:hypothetical protein